MPFISFTVPTSLLASIIVMRQVRSVIDSYKSYKLINPYALTGNFVTVALNSFLETVRTLSTDGCSNAVVITCGCSFPPKSSCKIIPYIAILFDSVPPDVKIISAGSQFKNDATCFLAAFTIILDSRP